MLKKVYLDFHGKKHSLYNSLINYPPEGYEFVTNLTSLTKFTDNVSNISFIPNLMMNTANKLIPLNILKPYLDRNSKIPEDISFIFSAGHVIFKNIPWVVDMEFVTHLSGYSLSHFKHYKHILESQLQSDNCKKILPNTDACKETIVRSFENEIIQEKVETVHLSVPPKNFVKEYDPDDVKLFFVGSQNLPKDFHNKGGKEVFQAFKILKESYDNLKLTVRSYVPDKVKKKYADIDGLSIIDDVVDWQIMEREFKSADIFLFPGHQTPGLAILDAMSYELPVITTDVWANPEMVEDGRNGFIINRSSQVDYYSENFTPNWHSTESRKYIRENTAPEIVTGLCNKITILMEDEKLRRNMGVEGRNMIENGKFSIENRNRKLERIFNF